MRDAIVIVILKTYSTELGLPLDFFRKSISIAFYSKRKLSRQRRQGL
jgi:hypothetical protein